MSMLNIIPKRGRSAYQQALETGFKGTLQEWIASLKGEKGDQGVQGTQGIQGPKGDKGDSPTISLAEPEALSSNDRLVVENIGDKLNAVFKFKIPTNGVPVKGDSAYEVAQTAGFKGTKEEWLNSLVGPQGPAGPKATVARTTTEIEAMLRPQSLSADKTMQILSESIKKNSEVNITASAKCTANEYDMFVAAAVSSVGQDDGSITIKCFGATPTENITLRIIVVDMVNVDEAKVSLVAGPEGPQGRQGKNAYEVAKNNGFTGTEEEWLKSLVGPKAEVAMHTDFIDTMLDYSKWTGDSKIVVEDGKLSENVMLSISPGLDITVSQFDTLNNAKLFISNQSAGKITIRSAGITPKMSIPIRVVITSLVNADMASVEQLRGPQGEPGVIGRDGRDVYEIAVKHGFSGTEEQWLDNYLQDNVSKFITNRKLKIDLTFAKDTWDSNHVCTIKDPGIKAGHDVNLSGDINGLSSDACYALGAIECIHIEDGMLQLKAGTILPPEGVTITLELFYAVVASDANRELTEDERAAIVKSVKDSIDINAIVDAAVEKIKQSNAAK